MNSALILCVMVAVSIHFFLKVKLKPAVPGTAPTSAAQNKNNTKPGRLEFECSFNWYCI